MRYSVNSVDGLRHLSNFPNFLIVKIMDTRASSLPIFYYLKVRHRSKIPIFVMFDPAVLLAFNVNHYPSYFVGVIFRT